ncbi:glycosyltransferase family 4 protein [Burkholderia aenigmatica]|uniref:glycosyltransferase family 4 protein n=1 Tax=Burkholderia aenigmatica TaxID=2015348 RepID=UPI001FD5D092|nr:glycosyltransferase family 1 protein [Burkholderia aenigmatica]
MDLFDVSPDKLTNTYQAVDTCDHADIRNLKEAEQEVDGIYGLEPGGYFLFFGAIEPKKNVGRLIEAYLSAKVQAKLVIVGALAWKSKEEMRLLESISKQDSNISRNIKIIDYVPRTFLMSLIRCAKAVVFPSLYEGFGLPLLEAMQLGVPTLCSSEGSLPEIAGDASVMVDPYNVTEISRNLERLDRDSDLRSALVTRGFGRAEKFSAESYRCALQKMYDLV